MSKKLDAQLIELMEKSKKQDFFSQIREVNKDERSIVHYASTKSADAYETILLPNCFNLRRFEKNPIVFWAHQYRGFPVGRNVWRKSDKTGFLVKTQFTPNQVGDDLLMLYSEDFLRGWSVGFDPMNWVTKGAKEFEQLVKEWKLTGVFDLIFTEVLLYEYSVAPLPANEDSLNAALADGKIRSDFLVRSFGEQLKNAQALPPQIQTDDGSPDGSQDGNDPDPDTEPSVINDGEPPESDQFITSDQLDQWAQLNINKPLNDLRSAISDVRNTIMDLAMNKNTTTTENNPKPPAPAETSRAPGISANQAVQIIRDTVRGEIRKLMGKLDD